MHSPETLAFSIKYPFKDKNGYRNSMISIWHNDPEEDGTDDSCGWFMRDRHGDKTMLEKIKKSIDFNFDRIFKSDESNILYYVGYFKPDGTPNMSTQAIVLNMFYQAAHTYFGHKRNKAKKWMQKNLFEILNFAENPIDSLHSDIIGQFRIPCGEPWKREYALNNYTTIIYGWLLRETRPWYKHPRWHIHHWNFQIHPLQNIKRRFWDKCSVCGKRGFKESAMSDWYGKTRWHQKCDQSIKNPIKNEL